MTQTDETPRPRATGRTRDLVLALDRLILRLSRHWVLVFNTFLALYVGVPFLAPVFMHFGLEGPARAVYFIYSGACHQLGFRSWYLFGAQPNYPRAVFEQATGINPDNLWAARAFIGNAQMGYKVAFCERDVAIYGAMFVFGLIYALPVVRARVGPLHWLGWILLGLGPIGLDGFSQLFSNYPYNTLAIFAWLPSRESTPFLRTLTGALFGLANVWLAYPHVELSMRSIAEELEEKFRRIGERV